MFKEIDAILNLKDLEEAEQDRKKFMEINDKAK
jgi:hypothetical protein